MPERSEQFFLITHLGVAYTTITVATTTSIARARRLQVTILARESGLDIELDDVPIRSLVPEEIADIESVSEFMSELPKYDDALTSAAKEASEAGEVLR